MRGRWVRPMALSGISLNKKPFRTLQNHSAFANPFVLTSDGILSSDISIPNPTNRSKHESSFPPIL
jgi:hypothetical protein